MTPVETLTAARDAIAKQRAAFAAAQKTMVSNDVGDEVVNAVLIFAGVGQHDVGQLSSKVRGDLTKADELLASLDKNIAKYDEDIKKLA